MTPNDRLQDLLSRWEAGRALGQPATPEELCQDCPELLTEVRQYLQHRDSQAYGIQDSGEALTPPPPTAIPSHPEDSGASAPVASPRYRRLHFHARGGLGEVFVGFDQELRREVALKRMQRPLALFPDAQRRFLREAELTGKLEHPGIVPVYGLVRDEDGLPCYAMRFIQGESLQDAIQRFHEADQRPRDPGERSLAFRELLTHFAAVCKTIAYAHSRGILHRDVKPANVMLGKYGETLVVDWGLARPMERTEVGREIGEESLHPSPESVGGFSKPSQPNGEIGDATLRPSPENGSWETRIGQAVGTPVYMSPEQAAGRWDVVGPASDLYSLGATLYTLLTGRDPFTGSNHAEILQKVQQGQFPPPRQAKATTPAALEAICLKAMARKQEDRYASALELAEEVEHWLADEPVGAYREPWPARARRWRRRHKPLVTGLTTLLLTALVLGGGSGYWLQRQAAERRAEADRHRLGAEQALEKVPGLLKQWRWQEAQTILDEGESRLGEAGPADLQGRITQARADLKLAMNLDAIRLDRSGLDNEKVDQRYFEAFAGAGIVAGEGSQEDTATRVRDSNIREQLVAALDEWAWQTKDPIRNRWLLGVARRADPDDWRDRFRDSKVWRDRAALESLAGELLQNEEKMKAQTATLLAVFGNLMYASQADAVPLLTEARRRYPNDFWLNFELGYALWKAKQWDESAGYLRAAMAVRPKTPAIYMHLGYTLRSKHMYDDAIKEFREAIHLDPKSAHAYTLLGDALRLNRQLDDAIRTYHKALDLDPKNAEAHNGLGNALRDKGQLDEANREFRTALDLNPKLAGAFVGLGNVLYDRRRLDEATREYRAAIEIDHDIVNAHNGLGNALRAKGLLDDAIREFRTAIGLDPSDSAPHNGLAGALAAKGQVDEAIQEVRTAIKLDPKRSQPHFNLGNLLRGKGQWGEAIQEYRIAVELDPKFIDPLWNLGLALRDQGKFAEALVRLKKAHAMGSQRPNWTLPTAQRIRECEQLLALDDKLPTILEGKAKPADDAERLALARLCQEPFKNLYLASARFYAEALANNTKLADDVQKQYRYNAACAAALAGCGQGQDADKTDEKERPRLRQQALEWLRADLALWAKHVDSADAKARGAILKTLKHWQTDSDLAGIRESDSLRKLPEAERDDFRKLWNDVAVLLTKVQAEVK